jgi:hypothetical protein
MRRSARGEERRGGVGGAKLFFENEILLIEILGTVYILQLEKETVRTGGVMVRINIPRVAFGCLVKPLAPALGAQIIRAGMRARDEFDSRFGIFGNARPQGLGLMEGPVDGNASFNASRYRCY